MIIFINMPSFRMSYNMHQLLLSMPHQDREAKQLKEERVPFGSQFEDTVHRGRDVRLEGP